MNDQFSKRQPTPLFPDGSGQFGRGCICWLELPWPFANPARIPTDAFYRQEYVQPISLNRGFACKVATLAEESGGVARYISGTPPFQRCRQKSGRIRLATLPPKAG